MLFTSVTFLFYFLPTVLAGYFFLRSTKAKNLFLLSASLIFYFWGEPWFVLVLLLSIAINFGAGLLIEPAPPTARRWILGLAVGANLLILATFKYAAFLAEGLNLILTPLSLALPAPTIALPLGISFFTFQAISYLIDVHRGHVPAERNPLDLGMYISMFPQLVAGPIVRYATVARQIRKRRTTLGSTSIGVRIFIIGLAQKVLIANEVAPIADAGFGAVQPGALEAWLGLIAYTMQIYFDFSGYSNMAIGLGLMFGFTFPRNFRTPYRAVSVTEFWRRWHISLSTWFRDYLYIPLGGSRLSTSRTYLNLAAVFLLCGLWHGASWTFVVWGAHHGALLILERMWLHRLLSQVPAWMSRTYALLAVMIGWVWFRSDDTAHALIFFRALAGGFGSNEFSPSMNLALYPTTLIALGIGIMVSMPPGRGQAVHNWAAQLAPAARSGALAATLDTIGIFGIFLLAIVSVGAGSYNPFLYFRF